jgi:hypothetical protein
MEDGFADVVASAAAGKVIPRDTPEPEQSRAALVKQKQADIIEAKAHWKKDFDRMRRNMKFAGGEQWPSQRDDDDRYTANITQRVVKQMVSALYAKNPTIVAERRKTLDFMVWDEKPETLMQAQQVFAAAGDPAMAGAVDPIMVQGATEVLQDVQSVMERRQMLDRIGKTMVAMANYYIGEGTPGFKLQMKHMVRRARTTGVGYVKPGFQRAMGLSEEQSGRLKDMAEQLAVIGRLQADLQDGESDPHSAKAEELRLAMDALQSQPEVIVREGVVFNFPLSTRIIPSKTTEKLVGWIGAEWVAEEILLTVDRVKEVYGVDVGGCFTAYKMTAGAPQSSADRKSKDGTGLVCVWHLYDLATGLEYKLAEGYPDFLAEPAPPDVFLEQFFPFFPLTFNDAENEGKLFPLSDVENMKHPQKEYNRSKEALRQHRIANRPLYLAANGAFEEEDQKSLSGAQPHDVIMLNALKEGQKATDLLQPLQKIGIDPNLYETNGIFEDMQRVTGNQEANLGGTGGGTATESNIAETSRQGSLELDADDLDEMLSMLFRAVGQIMLAELDEETAKKIAGPGAMWPQLSRREIMEEIGLTVKAGSSGRPDAAREAATFERIYPLLIQVPGISPRWLAERAIRIADDDVDLSEAFMEGMPSIMSLNKMAQQPTGDPSTDPNAQGEEGGDKQARSRQQGGGQGDQFPGGATGGAMQ